MWLFSEEQEFRALRSLPVSTDEESFNVIQVDGFEFHSMPLYHCQMILV